MRAVLFALMGMLFCTTAQATTIDSNGSGGGNWHTTGTWAGGTVPISGDDAVIENGDTVTCETGQTCTVGTSPANDTSTAALACASTSGTGKLVVNGTFDYQGSVRLCAVTQVNAGATLTHDSSLAGTPASANYSWSQAQVNGRTSSVLNLSGTSGSRVTLNIAAGSGNSGGFLSAASVTDAGQVVGSYFDVTGCGVPGSVAARCMFASLVTSGDQFDINHATFVGDGPISTNTPNAGAIHRIDSSLIAAASPLADNSAVLVEFGINNPSFLPYDVPPTGGGIRAFTNNVVDGGVLDWYMNANGFDTSHTGQTFSGNFISIVSSTGGTPITSTGNPNFDPGLWHDNLIWGTSPTINHDTAMVMPSGTIDRTYFLADNYASGVSGSPTCNSATVNYHMSNVSGGVTLTNYIAEPYSGGSSKLLQTGGAANGENFVNTFANGIYLPAACGSGGGFQQAYDIVNDVSGCNGSSQWCPTIELKNATMLALDAPSSECGIASERALAAGNAGISTGNHDNIFWNLTSAGLCFESYDPSGSVPNGTFVGTHDYNWKYNGSGGTQYRWGATAAYATTPGTHDQSGNPQFVDSTRNFLAWCKTIDPSDAKWLDCEAHFTDIATGSHNAAYSISALITWVRAGFAPTNVTTATAGSTGGYVGAVPPIVPIHGGGRILLMRDRTDDLLAGVPQ